jgi:dsRNA-specific ribonuclease
VPPHYAPKDNIKPTPVTHRLSPKMLADCLEACIGAYIANRGLMAAIHLLQKWKVVPVDGWIGYLSDINFHAQFLYDDLRADMTVQDIVCTPQQLASVGTPLQTVEQILGYEFANPDWCHAAFAHETTGPFNYERIEFLGDAILDIIVGTILTRLANFQFDSEYQISNLKHILVSNQMYSRLLVRLGLHKCIVASQEVIDEI